MTMPTPSTKSLAVILLATLTLAAVVPWPASGNQAGKALFADATSMAGLTGEKAKRVAFADINTDGLDDLVLDHTRIFINGGDSTFQRSAEDSPINQEGLRRYDVVAVGDVNNDGNSDLFLGRNTDLSKDGFKDDGLRSEIWLGKGDGGLARVKDSGVGAQPETIISACFVDYDRDGNLDLMVANSYVAYGKSLEAFPDRLFKGMGDGRFHDVTEKAGLLGIAKPGGKDSRRPSYGVTHGDWNGDGYQDLMTMSYGRQWNRLWRNNGDGTFTDTGAESGFDGDAQRSGKYPPEVRRATEQPFRANGNTFDAALADVDGDGDLDCFLAEITHWWAGSSSDPSVLLINQGQEHGWRFRREERGIVRPHPTNRWNQGDLHAGWLDVDNDGRLDLLVASSDYPDEQILRLYHQEPEGEFSDWTDRLGFRWQNATQLSLADFDRDGATDILLGTSNMRLTKEQRVDRSLNVGLFRNLAAEAAGNGFLSLRLQGQSVGAKVSIWIQGRLQTREQRGGLGHAGHRDADSCRFGVGKATHIDRLEVRWPDSDETSQVFENLPASRFYQLSRGGQLQTLGPW